MGKKILKKKKKKITSEIFRVRVRKFTRKFRVISTSGKWLIGLGGRESLGFAGTR